METVSRLNVVEGLGLCFVSLVSEVKWGTCTMQSSLHTYLDHPLDYPSADEESFSYLMVQCKEWILQVHQLLSNSSSSHNVIRATYLLFYVSVCHLKMKM